MRLEQMQRNREIYEMHKAGSSFVDIGKVYGLTGSRIKQICDRIDFRKWYWSPFERRISEIAEEIGFEHDARARSALLLNDIRTVEEFAAIDVDGLKRVGAKTREFLKQAQAHMREAKQ